MCPEKEKEGLIKSLGIDGCSGRVVGAVVNTGSDASRRRKGNW